MFGTFVKLFTSAVKKINQELNKEETTTKPSDKNEGVFDVVDTPNTDEFETTITPDVTQPVNTNPPGPVYDEEGYDENGFNEAGFDREGYNAQGYDADGYNREGFNEDGFDRDGYKQNGLDKDGYDREGYNVIGFDREGYNKEGFDINGFDKEGYNKDGFNKEGYNKEGFDKEGYNKEGYNRDGFDKEGYNKEGYNKEGYGKDGLDKEGYNKEGFDKEGYNKEGFDKEGYNKEGYDKEGYNKDGFDKNGYNREGYNVDGLDKDGYDKNGFSEDGFNKDGLDKDGFDKDGWKTEIKETKNENGKLTSKTTTKTNVNGEKIIETIKYSSDGKIASSVVETYSPNGVILNKISEEYNSDGSLKKSTEVRYTNKGLPETEHVYTASTGAIKTTRYDENGNKINAKAIDTIPGKNSITKNIAGIADVTMSKSEIYKAITDLDGTALTRKKLFFKVSLSGKDIIDTVAGGGRSSECLRIADKDTTAKNNGKNLTLKWGSKSQTLTDVNVYKADDAKLSKYSDYLSDVIDDSIGHMGYNAQKTDVYKYGSSSEMSKDIANSSTFKDFVNKNKDAIAKGVTPEDNLSFAFNSGDLYYSLASVRVIDSWVDSDGKTHLMLADIYDFNKNCTGDSAGAVLNRIGAAAQEDGELKAYALLMEVVI